MSENTQNREHINRIELVGTIVHKYRAGQWMVLTLVTVPNPPNRDYPKVYFYDELVDEVDNRYQLGDRVKVVARMRTSRAYPTQTLVGQEISPVARFVESKFQQDGEGYQADFNEALMKGEFVRVFSPSDDLAVITLKTLIGGYTYFPHITCFGRQAQRAREIPTGALLHIVAHIQTKKKEAEGETKYYQSVVCRNMMVE